VLVGALDLADQFARFIAFRDRTPAVAPRDRGLEPVLLRIPPEPQSFRVALLLAGMLDLALRIGDEIVSTAKAFAGAFEDDDMHLVIPLSPLDGGPDFSWHGIVDGVEAIRALQHKTRDPRSVLADIDAEGREFRQGILPDVRQQSLLTVSPAMIQSILTVEVRACPSRRKAEAGSEPRAHGPGS